jgi:hypothetical protein
MTLTGSSKLINYDELHFSAHRHSIISNQIEVVYLTEVSESRKGEIEKYLKDGYSYLFNQALPLMFPPLTVIIVDIHPELGIAFRDISRRAVIWPQDWNDEDALWFFGHEATEDFIIHHFGQNAPRWLVETFAQLGAYRMCRDALNGLHVEGEQECHARGFVEFESLRDWRRPHLMLDESQAKDLHLLTLEEVERLTEEYIVEEHSTGLEDQRYATAWKMGVEVVPENMTLGDACAWMTEKLQLEMYKTFQNLKTSEFPANTVIR